MIVGTSRVEEKKHDKTIDEQMKLHTENVNVRAALIHVIGDIVQSIGVIIAALIIYFVPSASIADPICTFLFSIIVIFTTIQIVRDCISVLMEGTPTDVDTEKLYEDLYLCF